jgi:hypothetical protein
VCIEERYLSTREFARVLGVSRDGEGWGKLIGIAMRGGTTITKQITRF